MADPQLEAPVTIVGAGVAGLSCARAVAAGGTAVRVQAKPEHAARKAELAKLLPTKNAPDAPDSPDSPDSPDAPKAQRATQRAQGRGAVEATA